jgi:hypothetical protein
MPTVQSVLGIDFVDNLIARYREYLPADTRKRHHLMSDFTQSMKASLLKYVRAREFGSCVNQESLSKLKKWRVRMIAKSTTITERIPDRVPIADPTTTKVEETPSVRAAKERKKPSTTVSCL